MKLLRHSLALASLGCVAVFGQSPDTPAQSPADKAFNELRTVMQAPYTIMNDRTRAAAMSREQMSAIAAAATEVVIPLAEKFIADFPNDPRRWQAVGMMLNGRRSFTGPDAESQKAAWDKRRAELRDQLLAASDADDQMVASLLERDIYAVTGRRGFSEGKPDLARAKALVELMEKRVPGSDRRRFAERGYVELLKSSDPAAAEAHLRRRIAQRDVNPNLAAQSEGMLRIMEGHRQPLELKFTAVDGRKVDLADYRGKVVLVDFWATWCVPCMEEMPNVKRVYAKYRDQGFDIIGISLDANPRDPAKPRKHEKTAEQLMEFVAAEGMPWPHHYDGKHWDNEYSRKYALGSIPATFLIGKDGKIYSIENHGDHLEENVKKLLAM